MNQAARRILLTPGPLTTSPAVKAAAAGADECPREAEFGLEVDAVLARLHQVAQTNKDTHAFALLGGPGTAAVESALGSLVPREGKLLVLNNGAYGARAAEMARRLGIAVDEWAYDWCSYPSKAAWAERLESAGASHAFWVHHETTTGLINPLEGYASVCRERGIVSLVDAMSSFAGLPIDWAAAPVDVFITSSNKCLQGLPGLGIVGLRRGILAAAPAPRSVALDLIGHVNGLEKRHEFPFTPPVPILRALRVAIDELLAEGLGERFARYRENYQTLFDGLTTRGFTPLLPVELHSKLLTAWREPAGFSFEEFHDFLRTKQITIYPGKVPGLASFRTGHIGAITPEDQQRVLEAVDEWIASRKA